jgi:SAM-dependent methyltransferase
MSDNDFIKKLKDEKIYNPVGDYKMVTAHAPIIDRMYFYGKQRERYIKEVEFISQIITEASGGKDYIDAGCGTGIHLMLMRKRGFEVSGFDIRQQMVDVALRRNPNIRIIQGDMRDFPLEGRVHGISAMYGAINYIDTEEGFRNTFRGFSDHLVEDGVAIIDTRYQPNLDEEVKMWSTDSWMLAKRWIKCEGNMDSVYRVFYAVPDECIMEMEDHRQYFQNPFWIAEEMKKEGFVRTKIFNSYDKNKEFDLASGSALSVVVGYKNE